jgi:hypothetical protein
MSQTGPEMGQQGPGGPPGPPPRRRRRSLGGPIFLIVLGVVFLLGRLLPDFDPWFMFVRFWPLVLICLGLGMIWDSYYRREHAGGSEPGMSGTSFAWIVVLAFFILAIWHGGARRRGWDWDDHYRHESAHYSHDTQTIEPQGAKSVSTELELGAGILNLNGGSTHLLEGDFSHGRDAQKPTVTYTVSGDHGNLKVAQNSPDNHHVYFENGDDEWNLQLGDALPIDMKINMGAGEGNLRLSGVNLTHLDIQMGVGQLHLDLTGERKSDLTAVIQGGVGQATIRLPSAVGVRVEAEGGIGSIDSHGLRKDGGAYVNDAYGKSPTSIDMTIHGGIGEINLLQN